MSHLRKFNAIPEGEEDIELSCQLAKTINKPGDWMTNPIPNILQRNRCDKSIEEARSSRSPLHQEHALGAHVVRHDFGRIHRLHRSIRPSENNAENYIQSNMPQTQILSKWNWNIP